MGDYLMEEWRDIGELGLGMASGKYYISSLGRLYSKHSDIMIKPAISSFGYLRFSLRKPGGKRVMLSAHRLVAIAFIPNPHKKETVNHKDGNKTNNRFDNLEWMTSAENTHHAIDTGLRKSYGSNVPNSLFNEEIVRQICDLISKGFTNKQIKEKINLPTNGKTKTVLDTQISNIRHKRSWNHISKDYSW